MAKVITITEIGEVLETSPMPHLEARDLFEDLKEHRINKNIYILKFI